MKRGAASHAVMALRMLVVLLAVLVALAPGPGAADGEQVPDQDSFPVQPSDEFIEQVGAMAHHALTAPIRKMSDLSEEEALYFVPDAKPKMVLPPSQPLPERTGEIEISAAEKRGLAQRGVISAYAHWCGMEWQVRSFMPYIVERRVAADWSDEQTEYAALIHTLVMEHYVRERALAPPCTTEERSEIQPHLRENILMDAVYDEFGPMLCGLPQSVPSDPVYPHCELQDSFPSELNNEH